MSNQNTLHLEFHNLDQAGVAIRAQFLPYVQRLLTGGKSLAVRVEELEDSKSIRQRNFYHGVILAEIAEQYRPSGQKFDMKVWKRHFREKYVGHRWEVLLDPMTGKKRHRKVRISTEELGVRAYSRLIDQVTAEAVVDFGVAFSVPKWEEYR